MMGGIEEELNIALSAEYYTFLYSSHFEYLVAKFTVCIKLYVVHHHHHFMD
jgi:hypothetical protein